MVDREHDASPALLRRLCWHSRRGMLELDLMLLPFSEELLPGLSAEAQADYRSLLDCEDPQLYSWLVRGEAVSDTLLASVVRAVREHARIRAGVALC